MLAVVAPTLVVAFLILVAMMLWIIVGVKGKWWVKLPFIIIVPIFSFAVWSSLGSFTGWPTSSKTPERLLILQSEVVEPSNTNDGAIYIWGIPPSVKHGVLEYQPKEQEPRAYRLPYSRELHQQLQNIQPALKAGKRVVMASKKKNVPKGREIQRGLFKLYILPDAQPPLKAPSVP